MNQSKRRNWYQNLDPANAERHVVFDLSIPMPERRQKAKVYPSLAKVAEALGVSTSKVYKYRQPGTQMKAADGKLYAIRVAFAEFADPNYKSQ